MDEFIVGDMKAQNLIRVYDMKYGGRVVNHKNPLEAMFINEKNSLNSEFNGQIEMLTKKENDLAILKYSIMILQGMKKVRQQISWKHWKKSSPTIDLDALHEAFTDTFKSLVQCFILTGLDNNSLTDIYKMKNVENILRQKHGY